MDENVDLAVLIQRRLDDRASTFSGGYRRGGGNSLTSRCSYLARHFLRRAGVNTGALDGAAVVVHNNFCPSRSKQQRVGPSQPSARARDDGNAIIKSQLWQGMLL